MTEAQEIAESFIADLDQIETMNDARRMVSDRVGDPDEIGFQMHDNIAEALLDRANAERSRGLA